MTSRWIVLPLLALTLALGMAPLCAVHAEDAAEDAAEVPAPETPDAAPPLEEEEPELTGDEKREHDAKVKEILRRIAREKNQQIVAGIIGGLGAEGTRAARDALIAYVDGNKNQEFVRLAFEALAKIGGRRTIEFLCGKQALRSSDFFVAQSAAKALAEAKDDRATGPLLDVMTDRRTKIEVVGACANALGKSAASDERVADVLLQFSEHKKDTIRAQVLEAVGYLASDAAVARLGDALQNDKNTRVRASAATGLKNTGRADTIPLLRQALDADAAFTVRNACLEAIKKLQGQ